MRIPDLKNKIIENVKTYIIQNVVGFLVNLFFSYSGKVICYIILFNVIN